MKINNKNNRVEKIYSILEAEILKEGFKEIPKPQDFPLPLNGNEKLYKNGDFFYKIELSEYSDFDRKTGKAPKYLWYSLNTEAWKEGHNTSLIMQKGTLVSDKEKSNEEIVLNNLKFINECIEKRY